MTATRTLLIAAAVAAAIGLLAAAALNPSVETWAARRAIAKARGSVKSVGRVSLALNRATLEGLRVEAGGAVLTAPRIDARIGVIPAALGWGLKFERLVAIGWTLDLIHSGAAAAAEAEAPLPVRAVGGSSRPSTSLRTCRLTAWTLRATSSSPTSSGAPAAGCTSW